MYTALGAVCGQQENEYTLRVNILRIANMETRLRQMTQPGESIDLCQSRQASP